MAQEKPNAEQAYLTEQGYLKKGVGLADAEHEYAALNGDKALTELQQRSAHAEHAHAQHTAKAATAPVHPAPVVEKHPVTTGRADPEHDAQALASAAPAVATPAPVAPSFHFGAADSPAIVTPVAAPRFEAPPEAMVPVTQAEHRNGSPGRSTPAHPNRDVGPLADLGHAATAVGGAIAAGQREVDKAQTTNAEVARAQSDAIAGGVKTVVAGAEQVGHDLKADVVSGATRVADNVSQATHDAVENGKKVIAELEAPGQVGANNRGGHTVERPTQTANNTHGAHAPNPNATTPWQDAKAAVGGMGSWMHDRVHSHDVDPTKVAKDHIKGQATEASRAPLPDATPGNGLGNKAKGAGLDTI